MSTFLYTIVIEISKVHGVWNLNLKTEHLMLDGLVFIEVWRGRKERTPEGRNLGGLVSLYG
jgi:hypothetical protein